MRKFVLVLLILQSCLFFTQSKKLENLDSLLKSANERGIFNGNIIVSENGKIIYQKEFGFADFNKNKKLTNQSTMPIGSITKEFNGAGILYLVEKGKLNLEDKISDYVADLPNWATEIRVKNLLNYTSGLPRIFKNTDAEYFDEINKVEKLEFTPGTGYIYSNANVFLQEKIIEKVTNQSYEDFLKNILFAKARIKGGKIPKDSVLTENMAGSFDNDFNETTFIHGGGEMYFSVNDLYNWVENLHNGKIINQNSLTILAQSFDKNSESGLGNATIENKIISEHAHQGSGNNYESYIHFETKNKVIVAIITNNQNFKVSEITESVLNILSDKPFTIPKKSIYLDIRGKLLNDFQNGISFYNKIKSAEKEKYDFTNETGDLINTGKYLMRRNRFEDAIKILELSTTTDLTKHREISAAYSFIGECYQKLNQKELAMINLKKSLVFDKENNNAKELLLRLEESK